VAPRRAAGSIRNRNPQSEIKKMTGTVKWFDSKKGFGFITPDDGSEDVFCHHTAIRMKGYRQLETGAAVEYETEPTAKGSKAVNIRPIGPIRPIPQPA
jgi:CspA family cold shock protein